MGFLDNSGDIILDVVLTDHGRKELSKGDGSFKITKFALGDEEIDYTLFNSLHASGSSYYDLEILQTPILEAFTDNAASMKTKLVTYENLELLFLPVLQLNEIATTNTRHSSGSFIIAVDRFTEDDDGGTTTKGIGLTSAKTETQGVIFGESLNKGASIMVDQGLNTNQISRLQTIDEDLRETEYMIQIDNRLGSIVDRNGVAMELSYIDDDDIAFYNVSEDEGTAVTNISNLTQTNDSVISGPRGSRLEFKIKSSMDLNTSNFLFTRLGSESALDNQTPGGAGRTTVYHIDSLIRVTGMNTGYTVDIPVRFVKYKS